MIGKLKGLIDGYGDDYVHIDVNGVVYEAFCSSKTMSTLPQVGHAEDPPPPPRRASFPKEPQASRPNLFSVLAMPPSSISGLRRYSFS